VLKRLTLRGFIVRDHEDLRPEFEKQVANWLRTGELVAKQTVVDGLENAVDAFIGLLSGANVGKMLVRLSPDTSSEDGVEEGLDVRGQAVVFEEATPEQKEKYLRPLAEPS
jgi:hypothetical protein